MTGFIALVLLTGALVAAGAESEKGQGIAFGAGLLNAGGDLGFQGTVTSPWFRKGAALRAGAFMQYMKADDWRPYYGFKAGLVGGSFMATADIRLYGEGGFTFLFPSSHFDDHSFALGGYGHFGFEFFIDRTRTGLAYYIELGSNGIGAKADKLPGKPDYVNGFAAAVGLRYYP